MAHHRKIMGDEKVSQTSRLLQLLKEVDNLSLDRDIQSAHSFITYQQPRLDGQRPSHGEPLTLASAEFVWVARGVLCRQTDRFEQRSDALTACSRFRSQSMNIERFADNLPRGKPWIERTVGVLKNNLQSTALRP